MADVKFTVEGKGKNLKKTANEAGNIGKNVDKSNEALDRAGKKQDSYNRREKGIYQSNLSSGKAYSKLAQSIGGGGSSSLVGAYATLAANVFALSAAFHALRDAAQFEQLVQGLNAVGDAAGRNLGHLGERLREITDNAISAERAMRAVAIGTSAGFSSAQLEKLTTVARGASIALGRDMGDAMDRLIRGAAKLEPEILDELGIMVRLDEATENYAATIGKTASQLTQYQRRMAFVTAINEQGLEKFEEIAASVDPVAYDQLAASLNDLSKAFLTIVNKGFRPFIDVLANSQAALIGVTALFASTISRQMLPALHNMAGRAREAAKQFSEMNPVTTKNIVLTGKLPAAYKKLGKSIQAGTASMEEMAEGQRVLTNSQKWYQNAVQNETHPDYKDRVKGLKNVTKALKEHNSVMTGRLGVLGRVQAADALTMANFGTLRKGWAKLNEGIKNNNLDIDANVAAQGRSITMSDKASKAAFKFGQRIKFVGASFVNALPWIGLAITLVGVLKTVWDKFNPGDKLKEATDEAMKAFDRLDDINAKLLRNLAKTNDEVLRMKFEYKALGGVLNTVADVVSSVGTAVFKSQNEELQKLVNNLVKTGDRLEVIEKDINERFATVFDSTSRVFTTIDFLPGAKKKLKEAQDALKEFRKTYGMLSEEDIPHMEVALSKSIIQAQIFSQRTGGLGEGIIERLSAITFKAGESIAETQQRIQNAISPINSYNSAIDNAAQLTGEFVKQRAKLFATDSTPFDDIEDTLISMSQAFEATAEMAALSRKTFNEGMYTEWTETVGQAQERLNKNLVEELKLRNILGITTRKEFDEYKDAFMGRNALLRKHKGDLIALKTIEKEAAKIQKASFFSQVEGFKMLRKSSKDRMKAEQTALETQKNQLDSMIQNITKRHKAQLAIRDDEDRSEEDRAEAGKLALQLQSEIAKNSRKQNELEGQINAKKHDQNDSLTYQLELEHERQKDANVALKLEEDRAKLLQRSTNLEIKRMRISMEMANLRDPRRRQAGTTELTAAEELKLFERTRNLRSAMIKQEYAMAVKRIRLDHDLLKAKITMQKAENARWLERYKLENADRPKAIEAAEAINKSYTTAANSYIAGMGDMLTERLRVAGVERDVALETLNLEKKKVRLAASKQFGGSMSAGQGNSAFGGGTGNAGVDFVAGIKAQGEARIQVLKAAAAARDSAIERQNEQFDQSKRPIGETGKEFGAKREQFAAIAGEAAFNQVLQESLPGTTEAIANLSGAMSGLFAQMRQLGPDGNLAATMGEGMLQITGSISHMADVVGTEGTGKMEKAAAIGQMVASTISATANIMAAASSARVAAIDKEIAAEKKRDGKSKESLKKIQQLEAKKEAMKKKAFNQNKKMQIAGAVANTATAMIAALAPPPIGLGPVFGPIVAGIAAAMGAAQIAVIAGTSYEGGGGSAPSAPSATNTITMGDRSNKVDIASGRGNAAGELAYLRGARGSGTGAHDFRPAFAGTRYRATGGAAYVVGEQGPELFVPSVPGRVVPNDEMAATASAGTVNFTINAIDATGVEEVLVGQRGNIIGMIRESANEYGTNFLEEVDTEAYTDTTEGTVYGRA